jgi:hypothetical protein
VTGEGNLANKRHEETDSIGFGCLDRGDGRMHDNDNCADDIDDKHDDDDKAAERYDGSNAV